MQKSVCITGLGYIGLPTACLIATSGYKVLGVDIDDKVLDRIRSVDFNDPEPNLKKLLDKALKSGNLEVSPTPCAANIHIIAVPTPLNKNFQPDLSCLHSAIEAILPYLRPKGLVLIESTCPIGTTESLAETLRLTCPKISLAYCPERVLPGNILDEMVNNDRVVGGIDEVSTALAVTFYTSFIKGKVLATHAKMAEAVKLAENVYRDINIAYANELSMIADHVNLDVKEWIRIANHHPRVQILNPGPGVGGHCIALDPWFLVSSASNLTRLTSLAREINTQKTDWVIDKIKKTLREKGLRKIACLGLTYKADVPDTRESPALAIVKVLDFEYKVYRVDPYVVHATPLYEAIREAEMIIGLVAHREFMGIPSEVLQGKHLLDFAGIFS